MFKRMGSFSKRASSIALKSHFIIEVVKMTFSDSNETSIGSDIHIGPDVETFDGVSSTITSKGEINFLKSFSLHVTLYRDKKEVFLEKLRKLFIKIRSPGESQFKPFGTIQLDLAQFTATNGAQELSLGVSDCIVVAAIVSLRITYVQGSQDLNPEPSVSSTKVETSSIPKSIPENHGPSPSPSVLSHAIDSPNPSNHSVERRNSVQRRSSVRGIISQLDEADGEEERANRATKELVERIQKQNEEYKKTNHALKSQLDSLTEQLIESNLQKAELLTNIDHEILEKRRLQQRLRWYEWSTDIWAYLDSTLFHPTTSSQLESRPEPPPEELLDTE